MEDPDEIPIADWIGTRSPQARATEDLRARIATLEAELARQSSRRVDEEMRAERAEAELARVKELAVWAARHGAMVDDKLYVDSELFWEMDGDGNDAASDDAGILAALERAMKGEGTSGDD